MDIINDQLECCICLNKILNKNISITECNHSFHTSCLLKYNKQQCPLCRCLMYELSIFEIEKNQSQLSLNLEELQQRPTLIDSYLVERNKVRKIIYKFIYIVSQIYVAIFVIFCLRIMCEIIWLFIYKSHVAVAKYLF
jgi:hypothetical protein